MNNHNILGVLARVYVEDIEASLPLYEQSTGNYSPHRFSYGSTHLANVGVFLLIQGADEAARTHVATVNVRDMDKTVQAITAAGGQLLEGPAPGPNGSRLIARHPDGNIFEYIALRNA